MAINFPDNPQVNETFNVGTLVYEWDGVKWVVISTEGIDVSDATAEASDVLASETFYAGEDSDIKTGTMPDSTFSDTLEINETLTIPAGYHDGSGQISQNITEKSAETFTPGTADQTITAGQYLAEDQTILGDPDLVAENIKANEDIFGITGTFTADADAEANDILDGKTAYVNGLEVTGNIPSKGAETITPGTSNQTIASGQYLSGIQTILGDPDLTAENIVDGVSIFGINGTFTEPVTAAPTITVIQDNDKNLIFTLTNNDNNTALITYELQTIIRTIELAASETSDQIVINATDEGLTDGTTALSAYATVVGEIASQSDTTVELIVFGLYELLADVIVNSNTTQIDFDNLDIGKDDEVLLVSTLETDAGYGFLLYVNGDTTNSNYTYQYLYGNGSQISAARDNFPYFTLGRDSSTVTQTNIKISNNNRFVFQSHSSMPTASNSSTIQQINFNVVGNQTISTITSLSIVAGSTNKIFTNSRFTLYKISKEGV